MGTFGIGSFANDTALDWLDDFIKSPKLSALEKIFGNYCATQDSPEICQVALEVLAALNGYPSEELPYWILPWITRNSSKLELDLINKGLEAVHILRICDLGQLWDDSEYKSDWIKIIDDIEKRLQASPKKFPKVNKLKRPENGCPITINTDNGNQYFIFPENALPDLGRFCNEEDTWIRFRLDFLLDDSELLKIASWFRGHQQLPKVYFQANLDSSYLKRGELLNSFNFLTDMALDVNWPDLDLSSLNSYKELRTLHIGNVSDYSILRYCNSCPIESLKISTSKLDFNFLRDLVNLRNFSLVYCDNDSFNQCLIHLPDTISSLSFTGRESSVVHLDEIKLRYLNKLTLYGLSVSNEEIDFSNLESLTELNISFYSYSETLKIIIPKNLQSLHVRSDQLVEIANPGNATLTNLDLYTPNLRTSFSSLKS